MHSVNRFFNQVQLLWTVQLVKKWKNENKKEGPTEIWTRIAGFRVQSANHYTMGPLYTEIVNKTRRNMLEKKLWQNIYEEQTLTRWKITTS